MQDRYTTKNPALYSFIIILIFLCTSLVFIVYDWMVQRRQLKVMQSATNANTVVSSIFPASVQQRILQDAEERANIKSRAKQSVSYGSGARKQLKNFLDGEQPEHRGEGADVTAFSTKPIADLFTHATVMFADISGFTAWSSVREPSQVFTLLETVYASFDEAAKKLRVFKVETIGKSKPSNVLVGYSIKNIITTHRSYLPISVRCTVGDCYVGKRTHALVFTSATTVVCY